jgi:hypothetical protein
MTTPTPPQIPAPALRSEALAAAVSYVLDGAAGLIADDGDTASAGLLECGAEVACGMYDLPGHATRAVYRRAVFCLARASGYQPLDPGDPVIDRALDELPGYPPERQARLLTYAARRAGTTAP